MSDDDFAATLQSILDEKGLSLRGFARKLAGGGASETRIESERSQAGRWLAREHKPTRRTVVRIAAALEVSPERLLEALPRRPDPQARLAKLEGSVADLIVALADARKVNASLRRRVSKLEGQVRPLLVQAPPGAPAKQRGQGQTS